jgi:hypothetical protein
VHYSKRWAIEDLHSEQSESSRLAGLADPLMAAGKGKKAWREEGGKRERGGGEVRKKERERERFHGPCVMFILQNQY